MGRGLTRNLSPMIFRDVNGVQFEPVTYTNKRRRYHERCYMCGERCKSTGTEWPGIGRVCGPCRKALVDDATRLWFEIQQTPTDIVHPDDDRSLIVV